MTEWTFGPDSMMWKVNRESILLLGGRAALLMQLAHPSVAAGVAQHSDFRADPVRRLRRTLDATASVIFGDVETSRRTANVIKAVHARIHGVTPEGRPYSAQDPRLLLWVHETLVDSSIRVYEGCVRPLSENEIERLYDETKVFAGMFNIPNNLIPPTLADMRSDMNLRIDNGEVRVSDQARELADPIIRPIKVLPRSLANRAAVITAALLPPAIRAGYGLRLGLADRTLLAFGGRAARFVLPRLPQGLRSLPLGRIATRNAIG
ncbi:MAG: DUF2236 domain-containing protein [Actinomycetota bacterium]|nr:DUF2236 domain-containing protein [Actinomycetota bacterium]